MTVVTRQTRLIHVASGTYPLFLGDIATYAPYTAFGPTTDSETLAEFGLKVVNEVPKPSNDVVIEGPPEEVNGEWQQTWTTRSFTPEEVDEKLSTAKATLLVQAEEIRNQQFERGFPYQFGEDVYHVQIRNADRSNLTGLRIMAKEEVASGGVTPFFFRVYENVMVQLTAEEMIAVADAAFQAANIGYQKTWTYKDGITAATTMEELPVPPTDYFTL